MIPYTLPNPAKMAAVPCVVEFSGFTNSQIDVCTIDFCIGPVEAALFLVVVNEVCPQPQTSEHLAAVEIMRLKHIIILQNKVSESREASSRVSARRIYFTCLTLFTFAPCF